MLEVSISDYNDTIICDINGSYTCRNPTIMLKNGREKLFLVDYLNSCPLLFKATDETIIEGKEILKSADELRVFSLENIYEIDWDQYQADINCECGISNKSRKHSIHTVLAEIIKNTSDFDFLLYDHGSGEIADFISVKETDIEIEILFFHVKAMSGVHYNSNVNDIYEVTGQAIKSIIWLKSKGKFLEKMKNRQRSGHCDFEKGNIKDLEELLRRNKLLTARMVIVQPSVSKSIPMPSKYQEILAAANSYIMKSGRVKRLDIWGSS